MVTNNKKLMIKPAPGYILVEKIKADSKIGGIYVPETSTEKPEKGKIIDLSDVVFVDIENHLFISKQDNIKIEYLKFKKDMTILYKKYTGSEIKIDGKDYVFVEYKDVIGLFE